MTKQNLTKRKLGNFQIIKLSSSRLKRKKYKIEISYDEALLNGEVIKLGENELLSTVQRILGKDVDFDRTQELELKKKAILKLNNSGVHRERVFNIQEEIKGLTFIPEIISIVFSDKRHYQNIIDDGLYVNGKQFIRILAGAGNIRRNTVFFIDKDIHEPLSKILNNGRDETVKLNPAKLSAYFGLYGSAGHKVSTPSFAVIPDYEFKRIAELNWIDKEDQVSVVEREISLNPFDGQGLISIGMADRWADELMISHIPSTFIFRAPFCKGQLVTFDFHKFAEEEGIKTATDLYGFEFLIEDMDVILSESQFKMAGSYTSVQHYLHELSVSELGFRISRYSPKVLKEASSTNYMFVQVLNLDDGDVENLSEETIEYFKNIYGADYLKTVLYLSGENAFPDSFGRDDFDKLDVLSQAILLYPNLVNERYFSQRIRSTLEKKEKQAKLGKLFVRGNYSPAVSDPYAQCQYMCGLEVTGLLAEHTAYSEHWNRKGVDTIASARSPLTHTSEMRTNTLVDNGLLEKWYNYLDTVFIFPVSGLDTVFYADSDFDGDLIFTTDNETLIKCQNGGLPISYEHGMAEKVIVTDEMIYKSDADAFNSKIGFITNTSSALHCMKYDFKEGSDEMIEIERRLMLLRLFQGESIDSGKNGGVIRSVPLFWTRYDKESSSLDKALVADRRPYFTKYLYNSYAKRFRDEVDGYNKYSWSHFSNSFDNILNLEKRTKKQQKSIDNYYKYSFFIFSDSPMNKVSKHIEKELSELQDDTRKKLKKFDYINLFSSRDYSPDPDMVEKMDSLYVKYNSAKKAMSRVVGNNSLKKDIWHIISEATSEGWKISTNNEELGNLAVYLMASDLRKASFCWTVFGKNIVENLKRRYGSQIDVLLEDYYGDVDFMFSKFSSKGRMI